MRDAQVFLDDDTDRPEFLTVNTGLFAMNESFVPAADADVPGDGVRVPFAAQAGDDGRNAGDDATGCEVALADRHLRDPRGLAGMRFHRRVDRTGLGS